MKHLLRVMPLALLLAILAFSVAAEPLGANVTIIGQSSRFSPNNVTTGLSALAGNVTETSITGSVVTKFWQGFYGNVSGNIVLGSSTGYNLYTWGTGSVSGEIYASRNNSRINWTGVRCASVGQVALEDTFLDADPRTTLDSLNQTFNSTLHPSFQLGSTAISGCRSTAVPGAGSDFWNAFLADNGTNSGTTADDIMIYTAIIDPDTIGFNTNTYDFQMLVGEPGNGSQEYPSGSPTTYYFYVELS